MKDTVSINEIINSTCNTYSVKDNSVRGCHTEYKDNIKPGDKVVLWDDSVGYSRFVLVVEDTTSDEQPTEDTDTTTAPETATAAAQPAQNAAPNTPVYVNSVTGEIIPTQRAAVETLRTGVDVDLYKNGVKVLTWEHYEPEQPEPAATAAEPAPASDEPAADPEPEQPATGYTVSHNEQFNSVEITFTSKPGNAARDALKARGFRWNRARGLWYGYADADEIRAAIDAAEQGDTRPEPKAAAPAKNTLCAPDKATLKTQFSKAFPGDNKMIDYCVNKVETIAILADGTIITVDKQKIETRFCFGESGYDYDDAIEMADHARHSQAYFKRENMKAFKDTLSDLEQAKDEITESPTAENRYILTYSRKHYIRQSEDCKLGYFTFRPLWDVLDDNGGSGNISELAGQTLKSKRDGGRTEYIVMTADDIDTIKAAYQAAAAKHEKKVDAYLKRYGTSKVNAWTYWRDA